MFITSVLVTALLLLHSIFSKFCRMLICLTKLAQRFVLFLCTVIESARSLWVYYFLSLTLSRQSVYMSVTDKLQIDSSFLFLDGIKPFFGHQFSMWHYKTLFFDFWFRPLTPEIYSPKVGLKSPISRLVRQIHCRCLHLPGGFRVWPIQWNEAKCCGADPRCQGNEIWARHGVKSPTGLFNKLLCARTALVLTSFRTVRALFAFCCIYCSVDECVGFLWVQLNNNNNSN